MVDLAHTFHDVGPGIFLRELADRARMNFEAQFWNADTSCLNDVVNGDQRDSSIRPNQILAVSLGHRMLPPEKERQVVDVVERELHTPLGLRSLSRCDPNYRGRYEGGPRERDSVYHRGTVWPWLIGPLISAYVKIHGAKQRGSLTG